MTGRIMVELIEESPVADIAVRLQKVFRLVSASPAWQVDQDFDVIAATVWSLMKERPTLTMRLRNRARNIPFERRASL
jgi:adenylyl- and sulfurtransferase ThiI